MDKPPRTFWQIWNMSFGFFGIQFGWGLQMANMSAIYEYLGARADQIPILWLAAPLTGLLVQPIVGQASDRTWGPLGRRRPYFLAGAIPEFDGADPDAAHVRHCGWPRACSGFSMPASTSACSRFARLWPTCCRNPSALAASLCRVSSLAWVL
jgi:MFS family permease